MGCIARIGVILVTLTGSGIVSLAISNEICASNKLNNTNCELVKMAAFGVTTITSVGVLVTAAKDY